jgi:hypothetical protein
MKTGQMTTNHLREPITPAQSRIVGTRSEYLYLGYEVAVGNPAPTVFHNFEGVVGSADLVRSQNFRMTIDFLRGYGTWLEGAGRLSRYENGTG